jgi:hypothetical protein
MGNLPHLTRRAALKLAAALPPAVGLAATPAVAEPAFLDAAAALLMVDASSCHYCRRWHAEVRQGYQNSEEGRFAPLMIRQARSPDLKVVRGLVYTPTFVAYAGGAEIGRIVGYQGADHFWGEIGGLLRQVGFGPAKQGT